MTEKRFVIDDDGIVTDMTDLSMYIDEEDCCEKLNELSEENMQLKSDNNRLVNETAKVVAEHQRKVFDLIDKSLEKDKQYYEMNYEDYLNGRIEALEDLKKELSE